ncbi:MAG: hypothetical protein L6Q95_10320 [Planctomycetes bacterium]|nr:hypothetical protein [Planctomycetota bacterium]
MARPVRADEGIAYAELLAVENRDRRFSVFKCVWRAAAEEAGAFSQLWHAVRDARYLFAESDPVHRAPLGATPARIDGRDAASQRFAQRIIKGDASLPRTIAELESCLGPKVKESATAAESILVTHALAELATKALRTVFGLEHLVSAGWPAYVVPWNGVVREDAATRLVARASRTDTDIEIRCMGLGGAVALAVLERSSGGEPERWGTWRELRDTLRQCRPPARRALEGAVCADRPSREIVAALERIADGGDPALPPLNDTERAIAELLWKHGPLPAKAIMERLPRTHEVSEANLRRIFSEKLKPHYGFTNTRPAGYHAPPLRTW